MYSVTFNNTIPPRNPLKLHLSTYCFIKKIFWWHEGQEKKLSEQFNVSEVVESLTSGGFFVLDLSADPHVNLLLHTDCPSFQQVFQLFKDNGVSLKQLILLTATQDSLFKRHMTVGYDTYPSDKLFNYHFKHIFFNRFFLDVVTHRKKGLGSKMTVYSHKNIQKHFLSLSRKDSLPRRFLNYLLHKENLFNYGIISHKRIKEHPFNISDDRLLLEDAWFIQNEIGNKSDYMTFGYKKHLLDDEFTNKDAVGVGNHSFHSLMSSKVFFELVNESWPFTNNAMFISEKLLKAILAKNIFVVFGNAHTLSYLRSVGFKTFSHIFDESYDEQLNTKNRVASIVKLLHNLVSLPISDCKKIYDETQEILDYNYNHLMKSKWDFQIHKKIENYINERSSHD